MHHYLLMLIRERESRSGVVAVAIAAVAADRNVELLDFLNVCGFHLLEHCLRDFVAFLDDEWLCAMIDENDADKSAVAGINRAGRIDNADAMLRRKA